MPVVAVAVDDDDEVEVVVANGDDVQVVVLLIGMVRWGLSLLSEAAALLLVTTLGMDGGTDSWVSGIPPSVTSSSMGSISEICSWTGKSPAIVTVASSSSPSSSSTCPPFSGNASPVHLITSVACGNSMGSGSGTDVVDSVVMVVVECD